MKQPSKNNLYIEHRAHKIVIIGSGKVGTTFAYTLLLVGLVGEIVLIDVDKERTEGEVMDLNHAVPLVNPVQIYQGDYSDCQGADVVVITAGTAQRPGESRLDLLKRNIDIFKHIVPQIIRYTREAIILVATNPVDILSCATHKISGLPAARVIGSGTILDTSRFRWLLGQRFSLDARNIHAFIIGEHGDSEVAVWSSANIAGMPLDAYCRHTGCEIPSSQREELTKQVRNAAYEIIQRKGATFYAVAAGLARIVESILRNQNSVLSISNMVPGYYGIHDIYLSLPAVVGEHGIEHILELPLSKSEEKALKTSAEVLKNIFAQLEI
ncbi:MAG: L-lactate dehydrogenase [Anaerolineaceae bacterium]